MIYKPVELLKSSLGKFSLQLRRLPAPLIRHREAELRLKLEHVIAHHLVQHSPEDFFFIQVGAFDGLANDPIHNFIVRFKWRGILFEPQKDAFATLVATYSDQPQLTLLNAAVAAEPGLRPLYKIRSGRQDLPTWAPQVASFRRDTVLKHRDVIPGIESLLETELVQCLSFNELSLPRARTIDLLQIDAEGNDFEVIKLFHEAGRKAHIISFEHKHLSRQEHADCVASLVERGYSVGLEGGDSIAYLTRG